MRRFASRRNIRTRFGAMATMIFLMHGGLTRAFVKYYARDVDYDDTDAVIEKINSLGCREMWDDASPLWFRPQFYYEEMYREYAGIK